MSSENDYGRNQPLTGARKEQAIMTVARLKQLREDVGRWRAKNIAKPDTEFDSEQAKRNYYDTRADGFYSFFESRAPKVTLPAGWNPFQEK